MPQPPLQLIVSCLALAACGLPPPTAEDRVDVADNSSMAPTVIDPGLPPGIAHGDRSLDCMGCHSTREPDLDMVEASELRDFHLGLHAQHGDISCMGCHNPRDYSTFRKSNGAAISWDQSMQLCAQCHGPQYRDYLAGAHGGMTGYWDTSRGGRQRQSCTACHDPHAPAFPKLLPVPPPANAVPPVEEDLHER